MEPTRLILVPQLRVKMRYQEWWQEMFEKHLTGPFDVVTLTSKVETVNIQAGTFSAVDYAIHCEAEQVRQFLEMNFTEEDVLLHLDLSFPGFFHNALFHRRPARSAVFCHATALNRFDYFQPVRQQKWRCERTHAEMYDKVFVASAYHQKKLRLKNCINLGALPNPPASILPKQMESERPLRFVSTARITPQKVDRTVEEHLEGLSGDMVKRHQFLDWRSYYHFLDRSRFLVVTSKEETYGYQIVDAILRGCTPIAPKAYSYPELLPARLLYDPHARFDQRAKQILAIAKREEKNGLPGATLKNDTKIEHFFENLTKELKSL